MSEHGEKDTEQIMREYHHLITTLFVGRFRAPKNTRTSFYDWESTVIDMDLNKRFEMLTHVEEDGGLSFSFCTIDNDEKKDIEESVKALVKKMRFILRNSKVISIEGLVEI